MILDLVAIRARWVGLASFERAGTGADTILHLCDALELAIQGLEDLRDRPPNTNWGTADAAEEILEKIAAMK